MRRKFAQEFQSELVHVVSNWETFETDEFVRKVLEVFDEADLAWEFGPHPILEDVSVFALSLKQSESTLKRAIERFGFPFDVSGYQFVIGIPPRNWEHFFIANDEGGREVDVDCRNWKFAFTPRDGKVDVLCERDEAFSIVDQSNFLQIFVTGELGEKNLDENVGSLRITDELSGAPLTGKGFRKHFFKLFPDAEYGSLQ